MGFLLDGRQVQEEMAESLAQRVKDFSSVPSLVIFQVGENSASDLYIRRKVEFGAKIGVEVEVRKFLESITEEELEREIRGANEDAGVTGVIVQLPLPASLNGSAITQAIDPKKDVDGFNS